VECVPAAHVKIRQPTMNNPDENILPVSVNISHLTVRNFTFCLHFFSFNMSFCITGRSQQSVPSSLNGVCEKCCWAECSNLEVTRGQRNIRVRSFKMAVFWMFAPCGLVVRRRFGGTCCIHHQGCPDGGKYLQNVGKLLPHYTALQPKRQASHSRRCENLKTYFARRFVICTHNISATTSR
jgi:hypothetical protein